MDGAIYLGVTRATGSRSRVIDMGWRLDWFNGNHPPSLFLVFKPF